MKRFILRENLRRYREQLGQAIDPNARRQLQALVSETERQLFFHERIWIWTCPHLSIAPEDGEAVERTLDRIVAANHADFGTLQLWDSETHALHLLAHNGFDERFAVRFAQVGDSVGSGWVAARDRDEVTVIDDVETADGFDGLVQWAEPLGIRAIRSAALYGASGFIGVISTQFRAPLTFERRADVISPWHAGQLVQVLSRINGDNAS